VRPVCTTAEGPVILIWFAGPFLPAVSPMTETMKNSASRPMTEAEPSAAQFFHTFLIHPFLKGSSRAIAAGIILRARAQAQASCFCHIFRSFWKIAGACVTQK
jgi:hypothetical protein